MPHEREEVEQPSGSERIVNGVAAFAFAELLVADVRMRDIGEVARPGLPRIERFDPVVRLLDLLANEDNPEAPKMDLFQLDRLGHDRDDASGGIVNRLLELILQGIEFLVEVSQRRRGGSDGEPLQAVRVRVDLPLKRERRPNESDRRMLLAPASAANFLEPSCLIDEPAPASQRKRRGNLRSESLRVEVAQLAGEPQAPPQRRGGTRHRTLLRGHKGREDTFRPRPESSGA